MFRTRLGNWLFAASLMMVSQASNAAWVSVTTTAPPGGIYTDVHFYTYGNGVDESIFGSQVALDFSAALATGYASAQVTYGAVGWVLGDPGPEPELLCLYFTGTVTGGEEFQMVLNLPWVPEDSMAPLVDSGFNGDVAWSTLAGGPWVSGGQPARVELFDIGQLANLGLQPLRLVPVDFIDERVLRFAVPEPAPLGNLAAAWAALLALLALRALRRRSAR
jgi:hypothetical protein